MRGFNVFEFAVVLGTRFRVYASTERTTPLGIHITSKTITLISWRMYARIKGLNDIRFLSLRQTTPHNFFIAFNLELDILVNVVK